MATHSLIASTSVTSGTASYIEFTNISAVYTDLFLRLSTRTSHTGSVGYRYGTINLNGSSSNFASRYLYGEGSGNAAMGFDSAAVYCWNNNDTSGANHFSNIEIYIPDYTTSKYKSISITGVTVNNATNQIMYMESGIWSNTAAINSIRINSDSGNFKQYSTAYLYGISNA